MSDKRTTLKQGQIDILELLYKYRFSSRQLLLDSLGEGSGSDTNLYQKLEVLIKHGLVFKRHEPRQKLLGVPYAYSLTPKGVKALQALPEHDYITDGVIKGWYRNKTVDQKFVNRTLAIHKYTNLLATFYPSIKVFTQRDLAKFSYFPKHLPDVVLSLPLEEGAPLRYFFDIIPSGMPRKALDGKLMNYCMFFESGSWEVTKSDNPAILLVASNGRAERQLQYIARARLQRYDELDLRIFTTTVQALARMNDEGLIWTRVDDTDEPLELTQLLS
jgi:DNA-binding PadR family transcriptional regulator